jgi:hypothetical protein
VISVFCSLKKTFCNRMKYDQNYRFWSDLAVLLQSKLNVHQTGPNLEYMLRNLPVDWAHGPVLYTLRSHYLQEINSFHSKLVTFA